MKNRKCPTHKHCFDYGDCESCEIGQIITKLHKRIERLKKNNETLTIQRNAWALSAKALGERVEVVRCKDCVYNKNGGCMHSEEYDEQNYNPEFFCADGFRSEDAE